MKLNYFTLLCIILINTLCILSAPVSDENAVNADNTVIDGNKLKRGCKIECPMFCPVPGACSCRCV